MSLSNPGAGALTVDYATASGTATAGTGTSDVTAGTSALTGTLTFAPGVLTQTVTLNVTNDTIYEVSEAFAVNLSNASAGAGIADGIGAGTIKDDGTGGPPGTDNDTPTLTLTGPATVNEAAGTLTYTVTLSNPASGPITVAYNTASGTATSGADFGASSGTLTFAPNVTSQTFTVAITNDTTFEGAENYTANLSAPTGGATIATGTVTTTINDDGTGGPPGTDNDTPALSIADISVVEGASAVFTVSLSNPSTSAVVFTPSLANGTATLGTDTAGAGTLEFNSGTVLVPVWTAVSGNVTIPAGATSVQLRLATTDDVISEGNETFTLTATPVSGATTAVATGTATITDNDGAPQFSINDVTVNEGAGTITFTVSLSNPGAGALTVDYATASGTATAGTGTSDVTAGTSALTGTLTFAPGVLTPDRDSERHQ
ncbi:MAG: hypothetical protein IPG23_05480 [Burkholderiales bacterium]|nr:hypothetical protein [Burkholderiales bacterium]